MQQTHPTPRRYLELIQDGIVFCLCVMLLVTMGIKLCHLGKLLIDGTDFSLVVGDILFILVLVELFRLLLIYLEEHRVSVATMVEVGIVATLRGGHPDRGFAHRMGAFARGMRLYRDTRHGTAPCRHPIAFYRPSRSMR